MPVSDGSMPILSIFSEKIHHARYGLNSVCGYLKYVDLEIRNFQMSPSDTELNGFSLLKNFYF